MWQIHKVPEAIKDIEDALREGWEPFAVTERNLDGYGRQGTVYHFRRQVPEKVKGHVINIEKNTVVDWCTEARAQARTDTLKEVGKWLEKHWNTLDKDLPYGFWHDAMTALTEGRMP